MINKALQNIPMLVKRFGWLAKNIQMISYVPVVTIAFLFALVMLFEPWGHNSITGTCIRVGSVISVLALLLWGRRILLARITPLLNTVLSLVNVFSPSVPQKPQKIETSPIDALAISEAAAVQEKPISEGFSMTPDEIAGALKLVQTFSKAVQKK